MQKTLDFIRQNSLALFSLLMAVIFSVWFFLNSAELQMRLSELRNRSLSPSASPATVASYPDISNYPYLGEINAPVVFVEYGDYRCGYCNRFNQETLPLLKAAYIDSGLVKFVFKDFILFGAESQSLAEATHCANEQGAFWSAHDAIFDSVTDSEAGTAENILASVIVKTGLDASRLQACLESGKYSQLVSASTQEAVSFGIDGTPSSIINGQLVVGAVPFAQFQTLIDSELNR